MSQGRPVRAFYATDLGNICSVRVQQETLDATIGAVANSSATGPATAGFPSAKVSKGSREIGIGCRKVTCAWDDGGAPTNYDERSPFSLPILVLATFNGINRGDAVVYLGGTGVVVSKSAEDIN